MLLNALKCLGNISDDVHLISPFVIEPVQDLKVKYLGNHNPRLHTDEVLVALSVCAVTNPTAENRNAAALQIKRVRGALDSHSVTGG
jgi:uncharacterized protein (UPF0371 family)